MNNYDDLLPAIERDEATLETAEQVSKYLHDLPLSVAQNDELVSLFLAHVMTAEQNAFAQGFKMGMEFAQYAAEQAGTRPAGRPGSLPVS